VILNLKNFMYQNPVKFWLLQKNIWKHSQSCLMTGYKSWIIKGLFLETSKTGHRSLFSLYYFKLKIGIL
jgi:hypothetical protein